MIEATVSESPDAPQAPTGVVGARLREAAYHTVVYGLGSAGQAVLGFLLLGIYTRNLTPADFGILSLVTVCGTISGAVFYLGASSALARYYFEWDDTERRRSVIGTAVSLTVMGAILQCAAAALLARPLSRVLFGTPAYAPHLMVGLATTAATFVIALMMVILRCERRSRAAVAVSLAGLFVTAAAVIAFLARLHWGVLGALAGTLAGQTVSLVLIFFLTRRALHFAWSREDLRAQLQFGLPNVLSGVIYYALDTADRVFIEKLGTLNDVGVYSFGYRVGLLIQAGFVIPFSQIWSPMRMQYGDQPESRQLFRVILTYYVIAGLSIIAGILVILPNALPLLSGSASYAGAAGVVPFVLLGHLAYGAINIVDYGVYRANRVVYHAYLFAGALVLNSALNLLLIPRVGYMGAAYATLASYIVVAVIMAYLSRRFYPMEFEWRRLATAFLSATAAFIAITSITRADLAGFGIRLVVAVALIAAWYAWTLSVDERQFMRRSVARARDALRSVAKP